MTFLAAVMAVQPRRDTRSVLRSGVDDWEEHRGGMGFGVQPLQEVDGLAQGKAWG